MKTLGLPVENDAQSHIKIVKAFNNSRSKGYHGEQESKINSETMKEESIKRITDLIGNYSDLEILRKEVDQDEDDEDKQKIYMTSCKKITLKDSMKSEKSSEWKKICSKNFDFIKQELDSKKDLKISAAKLARYYDDQERLMRCEVTSEKLYKLNDKLS